MPKIHQHSGRAETHLVSVHESEFPVAGMKFCCAMMLWPLKAGLTPPSKVCGKLMPLGTVCLASEGRAAERHSASSINILIWISFGTRLLCWTSSLDRLFSSEDASLGPVF